MAALVVTSSDVHAKEHSFASRVLVTKRVLVRKAKALATGAFKLGPQHTWHAIKTKPLRYGALLLGIGALGAGAKALGVNPEPWAIGLSSGTLVWSTWKSLPDIKSARGIERVKRIGAHVLWPLALAGGSTFAGMLVGHGADGAAHASLGDVAKAGGQSILIGADIPTIAQTALDEPAKH